MTEWSFSVPGNPPSLNKTYRVFTVQGKARMSKHRDVEVWQTAVAFLARANRPATWQPSRRVRIEIRWWAERKRDADAGMKALLDGIAVGLGTDDSAFLPTVVSNEIDKANPRTEVVIRNES